MEIQKTKLPGVYIIKPDIFIDERGTFVKTFNKDVFKKNNLISNFEENFYSISNKNVIRGMHFQKYPKDMAKLIYVTQGSILDVALDIRKNSPTYGQYFSIEISDKNNLAIYIPSGCAHGFLSLQNDSCTIYLQETVHSAENEGGIDVNSFNMDWGNINPIISNKDKNFPKLEQFDSPFIYNNQ